MLSITLFSTSTCAHCKPMKATLEQLAEQYGDKIHLHILEVDTNPAYRKMAGEWKVNTVPRTLFIINGVEIGQIQGNHSKERIVELIDGYLAQENNG